MIIKNFVKITYGKLSAISSYLTCRLKDGFFTDLMSDIFAYDQPDAVLLTDFCNPQVVMTAQAVDEAAIFIVQH